MEIMEILPSPNSFTPIIRNSSSQTGTKKLTTRSLQHRLLSGLLLSIDIISSCTDDKNSSHVIPMIPVHL